MSHIEINHDDEPIRLFKSDFLEFFTHISPIAVLIIWVPVVIFFLYQGITLANIKLGYRSHCLLSWSFFMDFSRISPASICVSFSTAK